MKSRKKITTEAELFRCVLFQTPVSIQAKNDDYTSRVCSINAFNDDILLVDGAYHIRCNIEVERVEIKSDADLYNCILFQTQVEIRTNGLVDTYTTTINEFANDVIFVDNAFYFRSDSQLLFA